MKEQKLLDETKQLADDFMSLAVDRNDMISAIAAECSQRLDDIHAEFTERLRNAGAMTE